MSSDQGLVEGFVDIEVLPDLRARLGGESQLHLPLLLLDCCDGYRLVNHFCQVGLCEDERDGLLGLDIRNFGLPSRDALEGGLLIAGDANHEAVRVLVLHFAVDSEMLITGRVVDLDFQLLLLNILDALVDIKHGRLVVLAERVVQIVGDEAGLAHGRVACQHHLDFLRSRVMRVLALP